MTTALALDPAHTALVVIDLQRGTVARPTAPYDSAHVVAQASRLATAARQCGIFVVLVQNGPSPDGNDALSVLADHPVAWPAPPPNWNQIVPELGPKAGDHVVRKRQWGAFYGTDLDLQLRRRHIKTMVLCGISTNFGVESTARSAYERGYHLVIAEDACAGYDAQDHAFAIRAVLSRVARIRSTDNILAAL